jgi:hypothetical protein
MRQKVANNAMLDLLTPTEFQSGINELIQKLSQQARFVRPINSKQAVIAAAPYFDIPFSPANGFLWELKWLQISSGAGSTITAGVYLNDITSQANLIAVYTQAPNSVPLLFPSKTFVLTGADVLHVIGLTNAGLIDQSSVTAQIGCVEVPIHHEAQLLL